MEFFIALFGGIFLIVQTAARSVRERRYKTEKQNWEAVAKPLEEALRPTMEDYDALYEMESWKPEDLYAYLEDDLREIFGDDFRKVVRLDGRRYRYIRKSYSPYTTNRSGTSGVSRDGYMNYWLTHLIYSKRGKCEATWSPGFILAVGNPEINARWCRRIEKNLNDFGYPVHLELEIKKLGVNHDKDFVSCNALIKETQLPGWRGAPLNSKMDAASYRTDVP